MSAIRNPLRPDCDGHAHVLVVDDQEMVLRSLVAVLAIRGCSAHGVTSAEAALAYVRDSSPRVLIVDVHLDTGDGIELAKRISRQVPGIRIFVMTGDPDASALIERGQRDGLRFEVLAKPTHPDELFARLGNVA